MNRWKIAIVSGSFGLYAPEAIEKIKEIGVVERISFKASPSEFEMENIVKNFDALILGATGKVTKKVLENAEKLKVIARHGIGYDNIDVESATEKGIVVCYTPHVNSESVAEHTFALILALLRKLYDAYKAVKDGKWNERSKFVGYELKDKVIGVIGFGSIGKRVAEIASLGFNMKVLAYDPFVDKKEAERLGVTLVSLNELLSNSDIVSIHAALTKESYHLIGERELRLMKKNAILINTARGQIVDENALIKALSEGWIAGAALDVLEEEPPKEENPLLRMGNVLVTPHIAAFTHEALRKMDLMVAEDVVRVYRGIKPIGLLNHEVLKKINLKE